MGTVRILPPLTSTPALQAAISAAGNNDPALGYSVAYPFGFIAPIPRRILLLQMTVAVMGQS